MDLVTPMAFAKEKSLRQCIQDLEASRMAYNFVDVEDLGTRCIYLVSIIRWMRYVKSRIQDHLENLEKGVCDEVLTMSYGRLTRKDYWLTGRMKRDMMALSDKPLEEYGIPLKYETSIEVYEAYEKAVEELVDILKKEKSTFDQPELYDNLMLNLKAEYGSSHIEYEYEQMKDEQLELTPKAYLKMQVQACVNFLKSGVLNKCLDLSNEEIDEVDEKMLHKLLTSNCKKPENLKELWAKLKKFIVLKEKVLIVPKRKLIRQYVLKHFYDIEPEHFRALFRLDMLLYLIHQDMVRDEPRLAKLMDLGEGASVFGIVNSLTLLFQQRCPKDMFADEKYDDIWIEKFFGDLLNSEHRNTIMDIWQSQDRRTKFKGQITGCMKRAGIVKGDDITIARVMLNGSDKENKNYAIHIGEGKNRGISIKKDTFDKQIRDWICEYVKR